MCEMARSVGLRDFRTQEFFRHQEQARWAARPSPWDAAGTLSRFSQSQACSFSVAGAVSPRLKAAVGGESGSVEVSRQPEARLDFLQCGATHGEGVRSSDACKLALGRLVSRDRSQSALQDVHAVGQRCLTRTLW